MFIQVDRITIYTHVTTESEATNLKESKDENVKKLGNSKGTKKRCKYIIIPKREKRKYWNIVNQNNFLKTNKGMLIKNSSV